MKNILLLGITFFSLSQHLTAQKVTSTSFPFLKGIYQLDLIMEVQNDSTSLYLKSNFPFYGQNQFQVEITKSDGTLSVATLRQFRPHQKLRLIASRNSFQHIRLLNLDINYVMYGETYCLHWDEENNMMSFTKQGIRYNYANTFTLVSTGNISLHPQGTEFESSSPINTIQLSKN